MLNHLKSKIISLWSHLFKSSGVTWQDDRCSDATITKKKKRGILFCRNSQPWRCSQHFPQLMSCMMSIESQMNSFQPSAWKLVRNLYWKRMACLTIVLLPKMVVIRMQRLEKRRENGRRWKRWKNLLIAGVVLRNLRRNPSLTMRVAKTSWRPCERRSSRTGDGSAWLEKSGRVLKFGNQVAGGYCLNPRKRYFNGLLARCATQTDFSVRLWWLAVNRFLILWQQWWLRLSFSRVKTLKSIEETLIWFHSVFLSHLKFDDIDMINIYIIYIHSANTPPPQEKKEKIYQHCLGLQVLTLGGLWIEISNEGYQLRDPSDVISNDCFFDVESSFRFLEL